MKITLNKTDFELSEDFETLNKLIEAGYDPLQILFDAYDKDRKLKTKESIDILSIAAGLSYEEGGKAMFGGGIMKISEFANQYVVKLATGDDDDAVKKNT
mgnify:CR=1 FL=1